jgi:predicted DNA binding CopG/RHH family protein
LGGDEQAANARESDLWNWRDDQTSSSIAKSTRRIVPPFKSEDEEAQWWFRKRKVHERDFREAAKTDELKILDKKTLPARLASSRAKAVSIRLPQADLDLARQPAERKGLPYQTYIKSRLHEALRRDRLRQ